MKKIEHIGIAVSNLEESNLIYSKLLNTQSYKTEAVDSEGVITSFFKVGDTKIELIQGINEENAISKFINKKGEGIHHIAFLVDNISAAIDYFKNNNIRVIYDPPKVGASNKLITFLHPKDTFGILIEISQNQ